MYIRKKCDYMEISFAEMEDANSWILAVNSPSLTKLFDIKGIDVTRQDPASFCGVLLDAIDLKTQFKRIQSFSSYIKVIRSFPVDPQEEEPAIHVFEVEVVIRKDEIVVVEKVCKIFTTFIVTILSFIKSIFM